jgi:Lsr2
MVASALPSTFFFPYVCHRRKVPDDLLIALNPEEDSSLPYLIRIPLGAAGIVLKTRDTWPRTSKLYCHRAAGWPPDAEIILRLPVRRCTRRGAAIDLILDRARENRSQFVITHARGREMIFWQSPKTSKQARQPKPAAIRTWARRSGLAVPDRGRIPAEIRAAREEAHSGS